MASTPRPKVRTAGPPRHLLRPSGWHTRKADYTIEIANGLAELGPDQMISTTLYNGQLPGPLLRFREGEAVTVDIRNKTDHPALLHWHGQKVPSDVDGAAEEGSRAVPPNSMIRETFTPGPSGLRFYHTHVRAGADLSRGQYSGQVGSVHIEPKANPGAYDQEKATTSLPSSTTTMGCRLWRQIHS
jgi:FtsP/CotA-like multicopper oxidase with cupredoxin domain